MNEANHIGDILGHDEKQLQQADTDGMRAPPAETVEQEIQRKGLVAPRITPADIEANIASVHYLNAGGAVYHSQRTNEPGMPGYGAEPSVPAALGLLTLCVLTLRNGFTVTGTSACASPENFDRAVGERVARADAVRQVWPLMGYALKDRLAAPQIGVDVEEIARVAHEVNRAYCAALGDLSQPAWDEAPKWQRESARMGVDLHMMAPHLGPEASHIGWMSNKLAEGWQYGPVKDAEAKTHPCLMPFDQLPREQQAKDYLFRAVVHALGHHNPAGRYDVRVEVSRDELIAVKERETYAKRPDLDPAPL